VAPSDEADLGGSGDCGLVHTYLARLLIAKKHLRKGVLRQMSAGDEFFMYR